MTTTHDAIVLIGGTDMDFAALTLPEGFTYLMLESAEMGIRFGYAAQYVYAADLTILRFHAFGAGGDLLIRRDEQQVMWRFVGYEGVFNSLQLPVGQRYPSPLHIHNEDERALLWGAYDTVRQQWYENRVGHAALTYPHELVNRVEIRACRVLDAQGQTAAFWTYKLTDHMPEHEES